MGKSECREYYYSGAEIGLGIGVGLGLGAFMFMEVGDKVIDACLSKVPKVR